MYQIVVGKLLDKYIQGELVSKKDIGKDADKFEKLGYIKKVSASSNKKGSSNGSRS